MAGALVPCRRTGKSKRHVPYLMKEIIFNILALLPADVLYNVMRRVCSEWRSIINEPTFASAPSPVGILIHDSFDLSQPTYYVNQTTSIFDHYLKVSEIKLIDKCSVCDSCNGLLLLYEWSTSIFHVANLLTNVVQSLPPCLVSVIARSRRVENVHRQRGRLEAKLTYTSHGRYKVFHVLYDRPVYKIKVCNVGDDGAWREIDFEPQVERYEELVLRVRALFVGGYVYWLGERCPMGFALDVDTEKMFKFPNRYVYGLECILNMGKNIGVVELKTFGPRGCWLFRKLVDPKSGEWSSVLKLQMEPLYRELDFSYTWETMYALYLEDEGELWFHTVEKDSIKSSIKRPGADKKDSILVFFNVKTGILRSKRMGASGFCLAYPHLLTLVTPRQ